MRVHSILEGVGPDDIRDIGSPVVVKDKALPSEYYAELDASFPSLETYMGDAAVENNKVYRWPAVESLRDDRIPQIWRDFIEYHTSEDFYREVLEVLGPAIARTHPHAEWNFGKPFSDFSMVRRERGKHQQDANHAQDIVLDAQYSWNSPVVERSTVRGPHLDSPFKLFAGLLYFRDSTDDSSGGAFDVYRYLRGRHPRPKPARIDPSTVEPIFSVPYAPNTLVLFVNSPYQIHGVTPRSPTPFTRKYINFVGECYEGRAPDFFIAPELRSPYWWRQFTRFLRKHT